MCKLIQLKQISTDNRLQVFLHIFQWFQIWTTILFLWRLLWIRMLLFQTKLDISIEIQHWELIISTTFWIHSHSQLHFEWNLNELREIIKNDESSVKNLTRHIVDEMSIFNEIISNSESKFWIEADIRYTTETICHREFDIVSSQHFQVQRMWCMLTMFRKQVNQCRWTGRRLNWEFETLIGEIILRLEQTHTNDICRELLLTRKNEHKLIETIITTKQRNISHNKKHRNGAFWLWNSVFFLCSVVK